MIEQTTIDRIFDAANIVDVVQDYITLKKRGVNYIACCPFHNEKTPSFVVSPAKNIYKCFGCGKAGNPVSFVMEQESLSYVDALKAVAKKYGIEVQEKELSPEEQVRNNDRESMMILSAYAQGYFTKTLHTHIDGKNIGLPYFVERGFSKQTIEKFQLGYCLDARAAFSNAALKEGYKKEFLTKTGLSIERDNGDLVDRFFGRVMFPIHSLSGRVIAFGGRTLKTDKTVAKYVNSPESEIYHKSSSLYGIFFAKKSMVQHNKCFLVEGYTDVISMHQAGVENVVASSGTSLTTEQIRLIRRFTPNVTVLYDGDNAGIKASLRGIDMLLEEGMNVKTLLLPNGEDPDSFARSRSAGEFAAHIDAHEEDFITFKTQILLSDSKNDPIKKAGVIQDIVRSISVIPDGITRSVYVKECSKMMDISEDVLTQEIAKLRKKRMYDGQTFAAKKTATPTPGNGYAPLQDVPPDFSAEDSFLPEHTPTLPSFVEGIFCKEEEKELIYYLLKFGRSPLGNTSVAQYIVQEMLNEDLSFQNLEYQQVFEEYRHMSEEMGTVETKHFINHQNQKISELTIDLLSPKYTPSRIWEKRGTLHEGEEARLHVDVPKAINVYKSKIVTRAITDLMAQIQRSSNEELDQMMYRFRELSKFRTEFAKLLDRAVF
ncbi:MAG: DNA primase [Prevotellaceae bacterium]|jgi:DNA primase|nr:DNA primase [Prevotellaceae bacterium]